MEPDEAPLRLEAYFIENISMETNPQFDPMVDEYEGHISVEPEILVRKTDDGVRQLVLRVRYVPKPDGEGGLPYSIDVTGRDFFSFPDPDLPEEQRFQMLIFNGASILFGLLRAEVAHITALGAAGSMLLPTVNLTQCLADWVQAQGDQANCSAAPKRQKDTGPTQAEA